MKLEANTSPLHSIAPGPSSSATLRSTGVTSIAAATAVARSGLLPQKRAHSRASTASIHSMDPSGFGDASNMYGTQWVTNPDRSRAINSAPQLSPHAISTEDMIMEAADQIQNGGHFTVDASMGASMSHHIAYQQHPAMTRHQSFPGDQYSPPFPQGDGQIMGRNDEESMNSANIPTTAAPRQASSRSSANNEQEMRTLFNANRHRSLESVAAELHGNERGPLSERTRQIFTMIWINASCQRGKGSVPRGRVYTIYAARCAKERIQVLNPASFGKLVRVLFPGLKTRRLGVRGESKYHYVNFTVIEDGADLNAATQAQPVDGLPDLRTFDQSFSNTSTTPFSSNIVHGSLPSPAVVERPQLQGQRAPKSVKPTFFSHSVYHLPDPGKGGSSLEVLRDGKSRLEYSFLDENDEFCNHTAPLELPPINAYLPPGTDPDAANALSALYLSHCTSLVETIRFVKEKAFFHLFTSFQGTLTMPVQKLLGDPAMAPWITGCDLVTYQRMIRLLDTLTLSAVPKPVLSTFKTISTQLVRHIRESFNGQPEHVIKAKEGPAAIFAALLDRLGRVNLTAHAATNQMSPQANRLQMYLDWIRLIRPLKVAECLPTRCMEDVVDLLLREMRNLIDPGEADGLRELESATFHGSIIAQSLDDRGDGQNPENPGLDPLDRMLQGWVTFLRSLPRRFPYASAAEIVWCVQQVGTAIMRDLTLEQGESFNTWWVVKVFMDEMLIFMVEQGGFLNMRIPLPISETKTQATSKPETSTTHGRKRKSIELEDRVDGRGNAPPQPQPGRAPFPSSTQGSHLSTELNGGELHDDSGIGIRTPEEDSPMDRFSFTGDGSTGLEADGIDGVSLGVGS